MGVGLELLESGVLLRFGAGPAPHSTLRQAQDGRQVQNDKFTEWVLRCRVGLVFDAPKSLDLRPHCAVDLSFGVTLFDRVSPVDLTLTFGKSDQQFCHPVFDVDL